MWKEGLRWKKKDPYQRLGAPSPRRMGVVGFEWLIHVSRTFFRNAVYSWSFFNDLAFTRQKRDPYIKIMIATLAAIMPWHSISLRTKGTSLAPVPGSAGIAVTRRACRPCTPIGTRDTTATYTWRDQTMRRKNISANIVSYLISSKNWIYEWWWIMSNRLARNFCEYPCKLGENCQFGDWNDGCTRTCDARIYNLQIKECVKILPNWS